MATITLKVGEEYSLANIHHEVIILTQIRSNKDSYKYFFNLIRVKSNSNGENISYPINPMAYFSIYSKAQNSTEIIKIPITNCANTTLLIERTMQDDDDFEFYLDYESIDDKLLDLIILVNKQSDGNTYSLNPASREHLKQLFPHNTITYSVFVSNDIHFDFQLKYGRINHQIISILTGFPEQELYHIRKYQFIDAKTNAPIK